MPIHTPTTEEKTMTNSTADTAATTAARSLEMNLFHEALSRARMRQPQNVNSEARRSARRVAMEARQRQARELGHLVRY
jgi:hypothetical protein